MAAGIKQMNFAMTDFCNQFPVCFFKIIGVYGPDIFIFAATSQEDGRLQGVQVLMKKPADFFLVADNGASIVIDDLFPIRAMHREIKHSGVLLLLGGVLGGVNILGKCRQGFFAFETIGDYFADKFRCFQRNIDGNQSAAAAADQIGFRVLFFS